VDANPDDRLARAWLNMIMEVKDPATALLPEKVIPLCEDSAREAIQADLPATDEWGLVAASTRR
jgi:hypothetical protein